MELETRSGRIVLRAENEQERHYLLALVQGIPTSDVGVLSKHLQLVPAGGPVTWTLFEFLDRQADAVDGLEELEISFAIFGLAPAEPKADDA